VRSLLAGVPIKPFGIAKARLAPTLDARSRSRLGRAIAAHTLRTVAASGATPVVVTGDAGVARWAQRHGWPVIDEPEGGGLDGAAQAVVAAAGDERWAVVHADLPLVTAADLAAAWQTSAGQVAIAPAHDGGTSLVAGSGPFRFSYGPGSFHRHFRNAPGAAVLVRPGLALDLDTVADLDVALALPAGAWLRRFAVRHRTSSGAGTTSRAP
jgi:2-phospho-L-lactate guanylyltransferase